MADEDEDELAAKSPHTTPLYWMDEDEVEALPVGYSIRGPGDWVVSGTLPGGTGPGRHMHSWREAEKWARGKYGVRLKGRIDIPEDNARWGFLIKGG